MKRAISVSIVVISSILLGTISGILWFKVGEYFDNFLSNFISWFILPAIPPLIILLICVLAHSGHKIAIAYGILFFVLYYMFHWLPIIIATVVLVLCGT
jgi:hypothetical protein